jgi:hypothetical protein
MSKPTSVKLKLSLVRGGLAILVFCVSGTGFLSINPLASALRNI